MPKVRERTVPHGSFTDHWIRVVAAPSQPTRARRTGGGPIEPYFERDRTGPEAGIYQGMGRVVYATLAGDARAMRDAAEALERALGADTTRGEARFLLGLAYRQLGRTDDAIRALERSLRVDADRPQRLHALARAYERAGRDPDTVVHLYERALQLQPALAWIRADYARFLHARGRRDEAEAAYRAALAEQPSLDVPAFNLGTLLTERGRFGEAGEAFEQAVRLNPSLGEALASLLEIRTSGTVVVGVRMLGWPLATFPVRGRGPEGVRLTVGTAGGVSGLLFVNLPPRASVRILEPDGSLIRAWSTRGEPALAWDLLTEAGHPIASGLYHVQVQGPDASGRPIAPQRFPLGVVRLRGPEGA